MAIDFNPYPGNTPQYYDFEQKRITNQLLREQAALLEDQAKATASGPAAAQVPLVDDTSFEAEYRRGRDWEFETRYKNDPLFCQAFHEVLTRSGLAIEGFDPRAMSRFGYEINKRWLELTAPPKKTGLFGRLFG